MANTIFLNDDLASRIERVARRNERTAAQQVRLFLRESLAACERPALLRKPTGKKGVR
jgi:predicted transcriptional regulator